MNKPHFLSNKLSLTNFVKNKSKFQMSFYYQLEKNLAFVQFLIREENTDKQYKLKNQKKKFKKSPLIFLLKTKLILILLKLISKVKKGLNLL